MDSTDTDPGPRPDDKALVGHHIQVRADRLALGDVIADNKVIVSVGYHRLTNRKAVRVAYQDPYTPPDSFKETMLEAGDRVWVTRP